MTPSGFERLVAVGLEATDGSRRQVESAVRQILATAVDRGEALVEELVGRGRGSTAGVAEIVRREIARQSALVGERLDELESRLGALTGPEAGAPTSEEPGSHDSEAPSPRTSAVEQSKRSTTSATSESKGSKKSKASKKTSGSKKSKASKKTSGSKKSKGSKKSSTPESSKTRAHPAAPRDGRQRDAPVPVGSSGVGRVATTRAERDSR